MPGGASPMLQPRQLSRRLRKARAGPRGSGLPSPWRPTRPSGFRLCVMPFPRALGRWGIPPQPLLTSPHPSTWPRWAREGLTLGRGDSQGGCHVGALCSGLPGEDRELPEDVRTHRLHPDRHRPRRHGTLTLPPHPFPISCPSTRRSPTPMESQRFSALGNARAPSALTAR